MYSFASRGSSAFAAAVVVAVVIAAAAEATIVQGNSACWEIVVDIDAAVAVAADPDRCAKR